MAITIDGRYIGIPRKVISGDERTYPTKCFVIAEAGTGHAAAEPWWRFQKALSLVDAAAYAGADAIKFQMFVPDQVLFCPCEGDEKRMLRWGATVMELEDWAKIKAHAESKGLVFLASVFQRRALDMYRELSPHAYKVASRAADTFPYDDVPGPFIVSTGMKIPKTLQHEHILMECVSKYPTPLSEARWTGKFFGLSDHSGTVYPAMDAISRGCVCVELHLDIGNAGPDKPASILPDQLKTVTDYRDAVAALRQD